MAVKLPRISERIRLGTHVFRSCMTHFLVRTAAKSYRLPMVMLQECVSGFASLQPPTCCRGIGKSCEFASEEAVEPAKNGARSERIVEYNFKENLGRSFRVNGSVALPRMTWASKSSERRYSGFISFHKVDKLAREPGTSFPFQTQKTKTGPICSRCETEERTSCDKKFKLAAEASAGGRTNERTNERRRQSS